MEEKGVPTVVAEDWATSIRWLHDHPDALKGNRALATFVKEIAEGAERLKQEAAAEVVLQPITIKSDGNEHNDGRSQ